MENAKIKIFDIKWQTKGAGPSGFDNYRTEIYMAGCWRARNKDIGPCSGCCNPMIWDDSNSRPLDVQTVFEKIKSKNLPKVTTFVGGEPTDQKEALGQLAGMLHKDGFHIILFTWRSMDWLKANLPADDLAYFDIIITEPYIKEQHIYTGVDDGIHNSIGSGNQHIYARIAGQPFDIAAGLVEKMTLDINNNLKIHSKDGKIYG